MECIGYLLIATIWIFGFHSCVISADERCIARLLRCRVIKLFSTHLKTVMWSREDERRNTVVYIFCWRLCKRNYSNLFRMSNLVLILWSIIEIKFTIKSIILFLLEWCFKFLFDYFLLISPSFVLEINNPFDIKMHWFIVLNKRKTILKTDLQIRILINVFNLSTLFSSI